ncbi:MAG: symmetrical bis(5'-nucleosyl)-tetraphosphatase [Gammaproteobacteria bacterium]|nr:symmetrical bis(5'-nucleosyl)-tetraphosphatase [Gammaproteobacteria bacterium]
MAIYAIGDLQGCYDELQQLLERIEFDRNKDRLWFVGDVVNRGPQSLECLRFVASLGKSAITVLGNHDLCLIASSLNVRKSNSKDTLDALLLAPDCDELLFWLRQQPLFYRDDTLGFCMVHAGLIPQWTVDDAEKLAQEVSEVISGPDSAEFFTAMYGNQPDRWNDSLNGMDRLRFIVNVLTRIRYCTAEGLLDFECKGPPGSQSANLIPWYEVKNRRSANNKIIAGHWSTLGRLEKNNVFALDTGCVWGGQLTAMRLDVETPVYSCVECSAKQAHD